MVLQSLKATFVIGCAGYLLAALYVLLVRFADLNYFVSQLYDALFDGILHGDRLAGHTEFGSAGLRRDTNE